MDTSELDGLVGVAARAMDALGEFGVGLSTLVETVFPPIPSEVILPLAGFVARSGELSLPLVIVAATLGSYLGALALYGIAAKLGRERATRWLAKVPLVDRDDIEKANGWFDRHGRGAVFVGRLIPGVRSLISLPAGSARMPLLRFSLFTIAGSLLWNSILILLGFALGSQYELVDRYSSVLNVLVLAVVVALVVLLVVRRIRRWRSTPRIR